MKTYSSPITNNYYAKRVIYNYIIPAYLPTRLLTIVFIHTTIDRTKNLAEFLFLPVR